MATVEVRSVVKRFGTVQVLHGIDAVIEDRSFVVLLGPSGCGKSTLLRMIAGLEAVTEGEIAIGGRVVNAVPPKHRDLAMVFQNYALYPHMKVFDNMAFSLKLAKVDSGTIKQKVLQAAEILNLTDYLDRYPRQLSGGQRQRVAMGRAIVRNPQVFLFDEPLSNLDAQLRVQMRTEIKALHQRLGSTSIYVTHDQIEAMTLGQRVAVLRDGVLQQVDTPQVLFRRPANLFVAAFIGSPSMNLVEAEARGEVVRFAGFDLPLTGTTSPEGGRVILGIRPTDFSDGATADPALPRLGVRAELVEDLGAETHIHFAIDAPRVVAEAVRAAAQDAAEEEGALFVDDQRSMFTARIEGTDRIVPGSTVELAVDTRRLHFFDPATGVTLAAGAAAAPVR
jgi:multiple sugar transport system ATP-binding protein